jgi:hypothetical protein
MSWLGLELEYDAAISALYMLTVAVLVVFFTIRQQRQIQVAKRRRQLAHWIHRARKERDTEQFSTLEKTTSLDEASILSLTASELAQQIRSKKLNALDVVTLFSKYCRKHGRNEEGSNAITEELYDTAYSKAEKLPKPSDTTALPFYGVPISVKECFDIKGTYTTGGLACRLHTRSKEDALVVKIMQKAGALPICCANTCQLMMMSTCHNNIWGRSRNPWDLNRTPGGSSGGDAALVAMKCVPLAIGGDVAGSIRIPAAYCGVIGFKPTSTRMSRIGNMIPRKVTERALRLFWYFPMFVFLIVVTFYTC